MEVSAGISGTYFSFAELFFILKENIFNKKTDNSEI